MDQSIMEFVEPILWLSFFILSYFLPTIIADVRKRGSVGAIFLVNLIFGWTIFGWFIALVWSLTDGNKYQRAH